MFSSKFSREFAPCPDMNKTYLRYELSETFGVVASPQSNAVYDSTGNLAISAALHDVAVWNLRQCSLVSMLQYIDYRKKLGLESEKEIQPSAFSWYCGSDARPIYCCGCVDTSGTEGLSFCLSAVTPW